MTKEIEGIVFRQVKALSGRRMVLVFCEGEGKVSFGTRISEGSRGGGALSIRPFVLGRYMVSGKEGGLSITKGEVVDAHFALGESAERFSEASFALELTDRVLPDGAPARGVFELLKEYLALLCARRGDFRLLTISYVVKVMQEFGVFSGEAADMGGLRLGANGDILEAVMFVARQPLARMDGLVLEAAKERAVFAAVMEFAREQLDLGPLKSERLLL